MHNPVRWSERPESLACVPSDCPSIYRSEHLRSMIRKMERNNSNCRIGKGLYNWTIPSVIASGLSPGVPAKLVFHFSNCAAFHKVLEKCWGKEPAGYRRAGNLSARIT